MHFLTPLISFGGLALASPHIAPRDLGPPVLTSQGMNLVVNVTDLRRDFSPSIHGKLIDSIHLDAGSSLLGLGRGNDKDHSLIFYVNGTPIDFHYGHTNVITDFGTPPSPWAISLPKDKDSDIAHTALIRSGPGDMNTGLTRFPVPLTFLFPETYAVCDEFIPYYNAKLQIVKQFQLGVKTLKDIPAECVPVRLMPQCATLNDLPKGSTVSHQWAYNAPCYPDVAAINWTQYPAW
ncbi:hypothetical protein E4U21_001851 [Claviceps maximensis]|nr:hypothetical protein E4U21_001851 [Claviceps maximensis]